MALQCDILGQQGSWQVLAIGPDSCHMHKPARHAGMSAGRTWCKNCWSTPVCTAHTGGRQGWWQLGAWTYVLVHREPYQCSPGTSTGRLCHFPPVPTPWHPTLSALQVGIAETPVDSVLPIHWLELVKSSRQTSESSRACPIHHQGCHCWPDGGSAKSGWTCHLLWWPSRCQSSSWQCCVCLHRGQGVDWEQGPVAI